MTLQVSCDKVSITTRDKPLERVRFKMKSSRKNTKNVPRITKNVVAMTQIQREQWFTKSTLRCNPDQKAEVRTRLDELNAGKYVIPSQGPKSNVCKQGKSFDFALAFSNCTISEFMMARIIWEKESTNRVNEMMAQIAKLENFTKKTEAAQEA